jgi:molybdopterin converting factor small subunit
MKIEIRLFATLASYAGQGGMDADGCLEFDGPAVIRDAVQRIGVPEQDIKLVFLNGVAATLDSAISDKDRVGFFPPIGGG